MNNEKWEKNGYEEMTMISFRHLKHNAHKTTLLYKYSSHVAYRCEDCYYGYILLGFVFMHSAW